MSKTGGVVAVTSLALEARIAQGPGVSVVLCNQSSHLGARLEAAIALGVSGIMSFGISGGWHPISLRATASSRLVSGTVTTLSPPIARGRSACLKQFQAPSTLRLPAWMLF
jgi:hypothetical protein